ncbi:pyridoxal-phosphate dependent enzyme [Caulobacter segnis]|uniref:pyridoxal-phosphate dependent enzyme n=1 Tax=Caulobacter segnis TaxID=88688 RepID=UPI00240F34B0|nr:pyridoxal-phosphate dependent enzyme [Caulobacter segnis]MDG2520228.1 pyridoxal-phosphate dependent enzyme [Caulobacter segnis]
MTDLPVSFDDIRAAADRIAPFVHRTPVLHSHRLDEILGGRVFFKCENLQRIGAFKARGAHNAVFSLSDAEAAKGVVTHSSGNHAAALALAARNRGIAAHIVMPSNAPKAKVESVKRLGGQIVFCEPTVAAREAACGKIMDETGAELVHPYDDSRVIAGQGTAALELLAECPDLDVITAPVGGGGLMSGTAITARAVKPSIRIVATEPAQADDAWRSWTAREWTVGDPANTIADGLRTTLGQRGFVILNALLDDFVTVSEDGIKDAMRLVWEVLKIVIEPSSAVPVAALLERKLNLQGASAGVILTGGNVDLDHLPWQA